MSLFDKVVAAITPPETDEERAQARRVAKALADPADWLDQIVGDHEQIERAFICAEVATEVDERKDAVKELAALLTRHSSAEEAVIYPLLAEDHKALMTMAYEEQQAVKVQLALLEALDCSSQDWSDKLGHIRGAVQHHVYEEEKSRFPKLKAEVPLLTQTRMTARYKEETHRYAVGPRS